MSLSHVFQARSQTGIALLITALTMAFAVFWSSTAYTATTEQVYMEWTFLSPQDDLAGFRLYKDGIMVHEINDPLARQVTMDLLVEDAPMSFTMTAFNTLGEESPHSAIYKVSAPYPSLDNFSFTATLKSDDDDALGVTFRTLDTKNYYRFSWDQSRSYRRLVKCSGGIFTTLAEDAAQYLSGATYQLEIVADGSLIEVFIDGSLIFSVTDASITKGTIGLYSWGNQGSHFDDILIENISTGAVLFEEDFSAGDLNAWTVVDEGTSKGPSEWLVINGTVAQNSNIYSEPTDASEITKLGTLFLLTDVPAVEILNQAPVADGSTFSTDEGGSFTDILLASDADGDILTFSIVSNGTLGTATITDPATGEFVYEPNANATGTDSFSFKVNDGLADSNIATIAVTILPVNHAPKAIGSSLITNENSPSTGTLLASDADGDILTFSIVSNGMLGAATITNPATGEFVYEPNTDATGTDSFSFKVNDGLTDSNIATVSIEIQAIINPPIGDQNATWDNYRVNLTMMSDDDDAIGVMFRYQDSDNYYRFSWDQSRAYRRLVKKAGGVFTTMAEDAAQYVTGKTYELEIIAEGSFIDVFVDGTLIFSVEDTSLTEGTIGLYSWGNRGSHFDDILVEHIPTDTVLFEEDFTSGDISAWALVDEGMIKGPSDWLIQNGTLTQSTNIYSNPTDGSEISKLGTYAFLAVIPDETIVEQDAAWDNYSVNLTMLSVDDDALGIMFRYQDNNNYYRFSWDKSRTYRRLVKKADGVFTTLAEDAAQYVIGATYELEIIAEGSVIDVFVDGILVFSVKDSSLAEGTIGLYSWGNKGSYFDDILVKHIPTDTVLFEEDFTIEDISAWTFVDEGTIKGPSDWFIQNGTLAQSTNIYSNPTDGSEISKLGTYAHLPFAQ